MDKLLAIVLYFCLIILRVLVGAWIIYSAVCEFKKEQYFRFGIDIMMLVFIVVPFVYQLWGGI